MEYEYHKKNNQKQANPEQTVYNYYINTDTKHKQKQKQEKRKTEYEKSDLDKFLENTSLEAFSEERVEESYNEEEFDNAFMPQFVHEKAKKQPFASTIITSTVFVLVAFLLCYNVIQFNLLNKSIKQNQQLIGQKSFELNTYTEELNNISGEALKDAYAENGFSSLNPKDTKTFVPNEKNVPVIYNPQTNWFDVICNTLYGFLN